MVRSIWYSGHFIVCDGGEFATSWDSRWTVNTLLNSLLDSSGGWCLFLECIQLLPCTLVLFSTGETHRLSSLFCADWISGCFQIAVSFCLRQDFQTQMTVGASMWCQLVKEVRWEQWQVEGLWQIRGYVPHMKGTVPLCICWLLPCKPSMARYWGVLRKAENLTRDIKISKF